ncbi:GGDEF domain-containing protein [Rivibacter subsaxonicus]|uniref:Diguanylate cyclase (GGDEF)-like protein n=1 Tax=Rivibacter subsaxonicus TaxID=457575 RepID=A0A4Q7W1M1_9BURK|nr:GGDEF domain-containing protein [Rivibacter subsaxonicus]RZU03137.1 diguanylate cyclase (GGDEF)-like protein [Rivibacter subsaxonicus]
MIDIAATSTELACASHDERLLLPGVAGPVRSGSAATALDLAIGDWADLLGAVRTKLRMSVSEWLTRTGEPQAPHSAGRVQISVLECADALDQLHSMLLDDLARHRRLELELLDAHAALARVRAELVGTRAGERRARHLAQHDSLTLLPNRDCFCERLDREVADASPAHRPLAVLYLDLDGFKRVNDAHGHDAGDELLKIVSVRLTRALRGEDMVGRLGGDEFGCLMAGIPDREHLSQLACKLLDSVSAPVRIGKLRLTVRPSIGIALCPADGTSAEALIKSADAAMYRAKRSRTGYAFFDQDVEG